MEKKLKELENQPYTKGIIKICKLFINIVDGYNDGRKIEVPKLAKKVEDIGRIVSCERDMMIGERVLSEKATTLLATYLFDVNRLCMVCLHNDRTKRQLLEELSELSVNTSKELNELRDELEELKNKRK